MDGDPRTAATRLKIIEAAERLVGDRGVSVSVRDILLAAGSANTSAVAYHFGSKEQLLHAVLARRAVQLDAERSRRLSDLIAEGRDTDPRALTEAFFRPLAGMADEEGRRRFAAFVFSLEHAGLLMSLMVRSVVTDDIVRRLRRSLNGISPERFEAQFRLAGFMFVCGLVKLDRLRQERRGLSPDEEDRAIGDLMAMFHGSVSGVQQDTVRRQGGPAEVRRAAPPGTSGNPAPSDSVAGAAATSRPSAGRH